MKSVKTIGINKEFHTIGRRVTALKNINLDICEAEFFVILGPSGCGKTTLLNMLAGLDEPSCGEIYFGEKLIFSKARKFSLSPKERNISMVFQSYALYPHMRVFDNIAFPLKIKKYGKLKILEMVHDVSRLLDIFDLLYSKPRELSGGQRQRVAIARALVKRPDIFLLDEPLSNLDAQLRNRMRQELKRLQTHFGITTVYVTHDQVEAMSLGDRIAIFKDGEIQQIGKPSDIYESPLNTFVASFIGTPPMNIIKGTIDQRNGDFVAKIDDIIICLNKRGEKNIESYFHEDILVGIRAEDIKLAKIESINTYEVDVQFVESIGAELLLTVLLGSNRIILKIQSQAKIYNGDKLKIFIPQEKIYLFNRSGKNIMD